MCQQPARCIEIDQFELVRKRSVAPVQRPKREWQKSIVAQCLHIERCRERTFVDQGLARLCDRTLECFRYLASTESERGVENEDLAEVYLGSKASRVFYNAFVELIFNEPDSQQRVAAQ